MTKDFCPKGAEVFLHKTGFAEDYFYAIGSVFQLTMRFFKFSICLFAQFHIFSFLLLFNKVMDHPSTMSVSVLNGRSLRKERRCYISLFEKIFNIFRFQEWHAELL